MIRKLSCFGFRRSPVPVPAKNLSQSGEIQRELGDPRMELARIGRNPCFSCHIYNNSRFACIENLITLRLILPVERGTFAPKCPKFTKFNAIGRKSPPLLGLKAAFGCGCTMARLPSITRSSRTSLAPRDSPATTPNRAAQCQQSRTMPQMLLGAGNLPRKKGHNLDCHPGAQAGMLLQLLPCRQSRAARHSRSRAGLHANIYAVNCKMG